MASRTRSVPSRAFLTRDRHRRLLTVHFLLGVVAVLALFAVNRFSSPDRFWAHWVALAWLPVLAVHVAVFVRSTMATMGSRSRG
jgi:hypothetical protein